MPTLRTPILAKCGLAKCGHDPLELAAAQVCRERCGRVSTKVMLIDLDVAQPSSGWQKDWRLLWMDCSTFLAPNSQSTPPWCNLSTETDEQYEEERPLQGSHCARPPQEKNKLIPSCTEPVGGRVLWCLLLKWAEGSCPVPWGIRSVQSLHFS